MTLTNRTTKKNEVLEEICNISCVYDVSPKEAYQIYNRAIKKSYIHNDWVRAIQLTERFVQSRYDVRQEVPSDLEQDVFRKNRKIYKHLNF